MNRQTRRRAVLGGLVAAAVGATSYSLDRAGRGERPRWLRPVDPLSESAAFAYVGGVRDRSDDDLSVEVATRARSDTGRRITLFGDTDRPVEESMPPLRGFWRFDCDLDGRGPGEYTLSVGREALPVELRTEAPPQDDARVHLTPRVTWRSDVVAHARGYSTGDGGGRIHVAFRGRTNDPPGLDALAFRDPDGRVVGRRSVPAGVRELSFAVDPLTVYDADADLVGFRDGVERDAIPLFYH